MEQLETNNHVLLMKNRFELSSSSRTLPSSLSRQLSDPVKVKRTPAFRNSDKPFQRGHATSYREKKSEPKQSVNKLKKQFDSSKQLHERSNSSAEIILNKNHKDHEYANITALYTQPIPKSLRDPIHSMSTMKIADKKTENDSLITYKLDALSDTLKLALSRPLPKGPAPQKPPRTFTHQSNLSKLFVRSKTDLASTGANKPDAKYMLDRLEHALKKNNQRLKKHQQVNTKSLKNESPKGKIQLNCLNWSNKIYEKLDDVTIDKIKTNSLPRSPKKEIKKEEPIYAEPFVVLKSQSIDIVNKPLINNHKNQLTNNKGSSTNRNSLYYMSTIVPTTHDNDKNDECLNTVINSDVANMDTSSSKSLSKQDATIAQNEIEAIEHANNDSVCTSKIGVNKIKNLIKSFEEQNVKNEDRVEVLERQLRQTLELSFNSDAGNTTMGENVVTPTNDSDQLKFETYVRTIRMISKCKKKVDTNKQTLFHCCLLVGLAGNVPYVKFKFPPEVNLPSRIEDLCFPDASSGTSIDFSTKAQNYSIVLTNDEGERIFGYCRRVLPEDSKYCLPLAYCILSKNKAPRFYKKILEEVESRHGISDKLRDELLGQFYNCSFPLPGQSIKITFNANYHVNCSGHYGVINKSPNSTNKDNAIFTLHQDFRYMENDLQELYSTLDVNILLKVFASLILERKVIFISCILGKLSTCIEAIQNILYPFSWHHTLIPVVPKELWEIVEAPTPVICGALSLSIINNYTIDNGIVIDLDEGAVVVEMGDESNIIPNCLVKEFKDGISLANCSSQQGAYNSFLSDAFLRIFVLSCGHYKNYIVDDVEDSTGKKKKFNTGEFVQAGKRKSIKRFLKWFTQTTMFVGFIDSVLADPAGFKIFDSRIQIYGAQDVTSVLEKLREWNNLHNKIDRNQL